jgi:DNA repair protein RecO (recombination protein O)
MPRPERAFRTTAIILRRRDFGEADRLLTILTPEHGKLTVIAKGARKPTSTKTGHVELFTRAEMLIHRGRELDIAQQAEMTTPRVPLREDLIRSAYANYVVELLDRFVEESDSVSGGDADSEALFDLLDETLDRLATDSDPRLAVRYYEMQLLDQVGFRPELNECVFSHEDIRPQDQFFSNAEGGVVSPEAAEHAPSLIPLSLNALKLLRHMQRSPYVMVSSLKIQPPLHTEVERILLGYITFTLERRLQSVDFIRRIRTL